MSIELTALTLAALLQYMQFGIYAVPANLELGTGYTMSARDREPSKQLTQKTARLGRAFENHFEGLILFAIAVGVIQMSGQNSRFTAACCVVYLAARVLYIPAYALGWNPWRSFIWFAGFLATLGLLLAAIL